MRILISIGVLALSLCVLPWWRPLIIVVTVLLGVLQLAAAFKKGGGKPPHSIDILTTALVALYVWFATRPFLWDPANWQPSRRDFFYIWGARARLFLAHGGIDIQYLRSAPNDLAHPDYPWLWPLSMDWASILSGGWRPELAGVLSALFGLGLLLILRSELQEELGSAAWAAAGTLAGVGIALPTTVGLAEAPYIAYSSAAILLLRRQPTPAAALLLGFAALTKNEGIALVVAVALAFALARRALTPLWPAALMTAAWLMTRAFLGIPTDLFAGNVFARVKEHLLHPGALASGFAGASTDQPWWFLALALALLVAAPRLRRQPFILAVAGFQILFFIGAYLISPLSIAGHVVSSWGRLQAQLGIPLLFAALAALRESAAVADPPR